MKKLLLSFLLISNLLFGQEAAYRLNGISTSNYDCFLPVNEGVYITNLVLDQADFSPIYSINYFPKNGESGWSKKISVPSGFNSGKSAIAACNLSNQFIVSIQNLECDLCLVMKIDTNGTIIWSRLLTYPVNMGDYGSNATPISLNEQDEITLSLTSVNNLTLSKLDTDGNLIFSKRFNTPGLEDSKNPGFSIVCTNDGGYLATMKAGDNPTITKLNSNLQVTWSKKWSIDSYSHPKLAVTLPNGNYCIIGEGDNGTYFARVDPNGNLLSYIYGVPLNPPYRCKVIDSDSIALVDMSGTSFKINLSNNTMSSTSTNEWIYGLPNYTNQKMSLLDYSNSMIYLDLESTQMGCFSFSILNTTLSDQVVYPSSVVDETIVVENSGSITGYTPTISTTNDVSMTLTCGSLGVNETEKTQLTLYPNPAIQGQKITLAIEKSSGNKLRILTLSGQLIEVFDLNGSVFTAPQESGMYFVQILDQSGNIISVEKLVVE
ncbi:MAG: hypothetical protein K0S23_3135 [Fluviicola sp.]|jgi:hypothetical protein|uniref:T9SS type A sorting domain-containing protein n=1 Tax=Fluviicola sp. TaxID=1917219 RepID=UPI0026308545|nr:T9SS type A sorting domain-containing protein [Fluviicola sp.]MDF3028828.1 hypothetical protein [Fluviicola sp.]